MKDFYPVIDYYFGVDDYQEIERLTKYFPRFGTEIKPDTFSLYKAEDKKDYCYYILYSTSYLGGPRKDEKEAEQETGFWIRNKNFLVKSADLLSYQGRGKPLLDTAISKWVYGEISHKNMNKFLEVTRNQYVINDYFRNFKAELQSVTEDLNKRLRATYKNGIQKANDLIEPFTSIGSSKRENDPFHKLEKRLRNFYQSTEQETVKSVHENLAKLHKPELENCEKIIDKIKLGDANINLEDSEKALIYIEPGRTGHFAVSYDHEKTRPKISISPSIFDTKEITFFGRGYSVNFVDGREVTDSPGISFNQDDDVITIDIFSADVKNYTLSHIDVIFMVNYAYWTAEGDIDRMKDTMISVLSTPREEIRNLYAHFSDAF